MMKHVYTIEAETEADLRIYTNALARYCADADFESRLRGIWKHADLDEQAAKVVDELWEYWHDTRTEITDD